MIAPGHNVQVLVATKPVDFRKGADGLAALVAGTLKADPFSGAIYVFRAKRADRVKLVWWDGTGVCLLAKRLEGGPFRWPRIADGVMACRQRSCRPCSKGWIGRACRPVTSLVRRQRNDPATW
jgi:transposase